MNRKIVNYAERGGIYKPGQPPDINLAPVYDTKGLGRWIYCKYCVKNVKPTLAEVNQVICPYCTHGLTPDFFTFTALKMWLNGQTDEAMEYDAKSPQRIKYLSTIR